MTLREEALSAFRQLDFTPSKGRGQNFLVHESVIEKILRVVDVQPADEILEVGPGLGFVTRRLAAACRTVWAIEVDASLVVWLRSTLQAPALRLIHEDVLDVQFAEILPERRVKVVANLPYSIATVILTRLLEDAARFSELTVMVQKEVADRLAAAPGRKAYGPLALLLGIYGRIAQKFTVSREAFFPRPRVESTVLHIHLHEAPLVPAEEIPFLRKVVRAAFAHRRKTLANSLGPLVPGPKEALHALLDELGTDSRRRAETLGLEEFVEIARALRREGPQTTDHGPPTTDHRPRTTDHRPKTTDRKR